MANKNLPGRAVEIRNLRCRLGVPEVGPSLAAENRTQLAINVTQTKRRRIRREFIAADAKEVTFDQRPERTVFGRRACFDVEARLARVKSCRALPPCRCRSVKRDRGEAHVIALDGVQITDDVELGIAVEPERGVGPGELE